MARTLAKSNYETIVRNGSNNGTQAFVSSIHLRFGKKLSDEQISEVEQKFQLAFKETYPVEEWIPLFAGVYEKTLTAQELNDVAEYIKAPGYSILTSKQKEIYAAIANEEISLTKRKEEAFQKTFLTSLENSTIFDAISEPYFLDIDPITANLTPMGSKDQYVQIAISLEIDYGTKKLILENLPAIRDKIIFLLSSKNYDELYSKQGKEILVLQIGTLIDNYLQSRYAVKKPIKAVLFRSFIIQ